MTTVDFFSQDEDRCAGCHLEFDEGEKIMVAMEKDWHPHCFRCYNCAKEFELDSSGERVFAMHKCKDGIDRPMHAACSQSYLDQLTKKTVRGGWKKETSFDNHIAKECAACAKEVKGQAKNIPWEGKLLHYHLTCFKVCLPPPPHSTFHLLSATSTHCSAPSAEKA